MPLSGLEQSVSKIATLVGSIKLDPRDYAGQEVDEQLVNWYKGRFKMFAEDGCRACIDIYMRKAQTENTNELTKLVILYSGLNM